MGSTSNIEIQNGRLKSYLGLAIAEAAMLLLPEEAVHCWIVASAQDEGRRYSMCFSPMMDLLPIVIPHQMRLFAVEKCFELADTPLGPHDGPPTELDYWCYIASLITGVDEKLYGWARQRLLDVAGKGNPNFSVMRIWLRSAPPGRLEADLGDPAVARLFDKRALRAWGVSGELPFNPTLLLGTYDELMRNLPQGFTGGIFALSGREADLKRWGQELFAVAIEQLSKPPFERRSRVETCVRLGANRMVRTVGFENPERASGAWSSTVGSWGVDYTDIGEMTEMILHPQNHQDLLDQELDRWRMDENQIQTWEHYELHAFGAWSALEAWSKSHPNEFIPRAQALMRVAAGNPGMAWHLGGFLHAVICCLLPLSPNEAWEHFTALHKGQLHLNVRSDWDLPEFFVVLWDLGRCNSPRHEDLRRHLFARSRNEFDVMIFCVAALANGAERRLLDFAGELLANDLGRERALGVSILAWIGAQESADRLKQISANDPSGWIRRHAEWAAEVSLQEKSARAFFRKLCHEPDVYRISAGLQVIKPALTPVARWWAHAILEAEKRAGLLLAPKAEAVLESFWYHVNATHSSTVEVFGRKLDRFCRGEELDRHKSSKLAPWWNID